jgi:hypothetical protein
MREAVEHRELEEACCEKVESRRGESRRLVQVAREARDEAGQETLWFAVPVVALFAAIVDDLVTVVSTARGLPCSRSKSGKSGHRKARVRSVRQCCILCG